MFKSVEIKYGEINLIKNIDYLFISKDFLGLKFSITLINSFSLIGNNLNLVVLKIY